MADLTTMLSRFLATLGTGLAVPGILNVNTTAVGNVGTGTDDLITYDVPANMLNKTGQGLRVRAWGTFAGTAVTKTLTFNFGSTVVETEVVAAATVAANLVTGQWTIDALIIRTGSSTQTVVVHLVQMMGGTAAIRDITETRDVVSATETDTSAITIKCTGNATNNNDIVQSGLIVEGFI